MASRTVALGLTLAVVALLAVAAWPSPALTERWVSDTGRAGTVNHHAPTAGLLDGRGLVFAPISAGGDGRCELAALDAADGSVRWSYPVPEPRCTIHAVADPALADYDGDGGREVLAATTEDVVVGFEPHDGAVEFRHELTDYGYSAPVVADLDGDGRNEIVVVDVSGTVTVLGPDATVRWERRLSRHTVAAPAVADFDGDGALELAVGSSRAGTLTLLEADGTTAWNRSAPADGPITWLTTAEAGPAATVVVASSDGVVAAVDGRDGSIRWRRDLGTLAAVHAVGDGDGDGDLEVYAVAADAVLRSYAAADGAVEWTRRLTTADVQMTPPPVLGDLDGDGDPELVAATNDGRVVVVAPEGGEIVASYRRDVVVWTHPATADVTGDGAEEIFVTYGDGRVVSLSLAG